MRILVQYALSAQALWWRRESLLQSPSRYSPLSQDPLFGTEAHRGNTTVITSKNTVHCRAHLCRTHWQSQRALFPVGTFCAGLLISPAAVWEGKQEAANDCSARTGQKVTTIVVCGCYRPYFMQLCYNNQIWQRKRNQVCKSNETKFSSEDQSIVHWKAE